MALELIGGVRLEAAPINGRSATGEFDGGCLIVVVLNCGKVETQLDICDNVILASLIFDFERVF